MGKQYDEKHVTDLLKRNTDIKVNTTSKTITTVRDSSKVGNGSWGKIDYLVKVHGYTHLFK